jgi:hypothetical protein
MFGSGQIERPYADPIDVAYLVIYTLALFFFLIATMEVQEELRRPYRHPDLLSVAPAIAFMTTPSVP